MEILKLKLRGFIGIKKGLGLDEIEIDFSKLNGLVAFDGPNGHGKTTVLDCMHFYRCMASRDGALQHHVFLRDSVKEFTASHEGNTYRTVVKIDSESGRQEGFIYKNGSEESEVKGKTPEYDKYIIELSGSKSLFFNSVFCAQNSDKISDMDTGSLRALFSEFCKHGDLVAWENTSKQCVNILTGQEEGKDKKITDLKSEIETLGGNQIIKQDYMLELASAEELNRTRNIALEQTVEKLAETRESLSKEGVVVQRIEDQKKVAEQLKTDINTDQLFTDQTLGEKRSVIHDLRNQQQTDTLLLSEKEVIIKAGEIVISEKPILEELRLKLSKKQTEKDSAFKLFSEASEALKEEINNLKTLESDSDINNIQNQIDICFEKSEDLQKKDPECKSSTCSFILGALEAAKKLPEVQFKISEMKTALTIKKDHLKASIQLLEKGSKVRSDALNVIETECISINSNINVSEKILEEAEKQAKLLPEITGAEERLKNSKQREEELIDEGLKLKTDFEAREAEKKQQLTAVETILTGLESGLDGSLSMLSVTLQTEVDDLKILIKMNADNITDITVKIEKEKDNEADLKSKNGLLATLVIEKQLIMKERAEWQHLKNACSKDGLRALELDGVSPIITGFANDLMISSGFNDYTVKIKTQDEETGKEIFQIWAIRADGSETLLDMLSGGEKVWGLKAIRLGLTLLSSEKSGINFKTALADEEDGALSTDNAINFIGLYRSFMSEGGFTTCFFITHRFECVALADHVFKFLPGGIEFER